MAAVQRQSHRIDMNNMSNLIVTRDPVVAYHYGYTVNGLNRPNIGILGSNPI
jgi:hypothetical protein